MVKRRSLCCCTLSTEIVLTHKCITLVTVMLLCSNIANGVIYKEEKLIWLKAWEAEESKMNPVRAFLLCHSMAEGVTWVRQSEKRAELAFKTSPLWLLPQVHACIHMNALQKVCLSHRILQDTLNLLQAFGNTHLSFVY